MSTVEPSQLHDDLKDEIVELIRKHSERMSAVEVLAISAQLVGMGIAIQDQTQYTPEQIHDIVRKNIEMGNQSIIDDLLNATPGGHA